MVPLGTNQIRSTFPIPDFYLSLIWKFPHQTNFGQQIKRHGVARIWKILEGIHETEAIAM
jgi:hypothetical protein